MGYCAHGGGYIKPKTKDEYDKILQWLDDNDELYHYVDGNCTIYLEQSDKYCEHQWYNMIAFTKGRLSDGCIKFVGEDDALWAFKYNPVSDSLVEYGGHVVYDIGPVNEPVGQIIDGFEDFLDRRGVVLDNPERDEDADVSDPDTMANIYGSDYGELQTYIEDTLRRWGLIE